MPAKSAETMALLGIGLADSFIGCWHSKFEYDLLRPVTYIRRVIDPAFEPLLITPPFPEYPSGHSTQSGAAAQILTVCLARTGPSPTAPTRKTDCPAAAFRTSGPQRTRQAFRGFTAASTSAPRSTAASTRAAASATSPPR